MIVKICQACIEQGTRLYPASLQAVASLRCCRAEDSQPKEGLLLRTLRQREISVSAVAAICESNSGTPAPTGGSGRLGSITKICTL